MLRAHWHYKTSSGKCTCINFGISPGSKNQIFVQFILSIQKLYWCPYYIGKFLSYGCSFWMSLTFSKPLVLKRLVIRCFFFFSYMFFFFGLLHFKLTFIAFLFWIVFDTYIGFPQNCETHSLLKESHELSS